jgi:2-hydroxy-3-keto-5-methylthiopentenyl-1-phosphate phosphatase
VLTLFEEHTTPLNEYERETLLPIVIRGLKTHYGKENAIKSEEIVTKLKEKGFDISGVRLRKIIHHIREHALLVCVVGSSQGYYVSEELEDMKKQSDSIRGREIALERIRRKIDEAIMIKENKLRTV